MEEKKYKRFRGSVTPRAASAKDPELDKVIVTITILAIITITSIFAFFPPHHQYNTSMNIISIPILTIIIYINNIIPIIIYIYNILLVIPIIQVEEGEEEEAQGEEEKAKEERAKEDLNSLSDLDELLFCRSVNQVKVRTTTNIRP